MPSPDQRAREGLSEAQRGIGLDLGKHAGQQAVRAAVAVALLADDPRQRAGIHLVALMTMTGAALAEIDKAEGRRVRAGKFSQDAYDLVMAVLADLNPSSGRRALQEPESHG